MLWKPEVVKITQGADNVGTYNKTPQSYRKWCKTCGGHIFTKHPNLVLMDVCAEVIPTFLSKPGVHVNCKKAVLNIQYGVPKLMDFWAEMGGSGKSVAE